MAKDIDEKIGARSKKKLHGLKYKIPLKNYRVHEMPTGDQLPPHYIAGYILLNNEPYCTVRWGTVWVDTI